MSAREHNKLVKAIAEAEMRKYSRETPMEELSGYAKRIKEEAKGKSKGVKKGLAVELRALAKVLPREAREIAREVRVEAIDISAMDRMVRQAPKARAAPKEVAVPDRSPVVARAAAANPLPAPAAAAAAAEEFVEPDLATLIASGMAGGAPKAAGGAGGPAKAYTLADSLLALGEVFEKRIDIRVRKGIVTEKLYDVKEEQPGYWEEISPLSGKVIEVTIAHMTVLFFIRPLGLVQVRVAPHNKSVDPEDALKSVLKALYIVGSNEPMNAERWMKEHIRIRTDLGSGESELETEFFRLLQLLNGRDLKSLIYSLNYKHKQMDDPLISYSDSDTRADLLRKIENDDIRPDDMREQISYYSMYYGPKAIMKPVGGSAEEYEETSARLKITLAKEKVEEEARQAAKAKKEAAKLARKAKKAATA